MQFDKKSLNRLILPLIGEQFLGVMVGFADTVMVASSGEAAMSGVALVDFITMLFLQVFSALCTGGAVIISQYLGRKDDASGGHAAVQLLQTTVFISVFLTLLSLLGRRQILSIIFGNVEADVMRSAFVYFSIIICSFPFIGLHNAGSAILRSLGDTRKCLKISVIMNLINVCGNALLIYGFGMGVAGAALASLFSRAAASSLAVYFLCRRKTPFSITKFFSTRPNWSVIRRILGIGVPSGLENSMFQIGKILVQQLVTSFGTIAIAANSAAGTIVCLATIPGNAISLALLTVSGQCMGARSPEENSRNTRYLMKASYLAIGVCNLIVWLALPYLIGIYHLRPETSSIASSLVIWHCIFSTLLWTPAFALPSTLRGAGDVRFTLKVSMGSMLVCRIGFSFLFGKILGLGILGIWFAIFMDWLVRSVLFMVRFRSGKWKDRDLLS